MSRSPKEARDHGNDGDVVHLHLVHPGIWELHVAGLDRMSFSFTPPFRESYEIEGYGKGPVAMSRWTSESGMLSCRVLHKLGGEDLAEHLWRAMRDDAYRGLDLTWPGDDHHEEPPGAIPEDVWTRTCAVRVSLDPIEGGVPWPITLTGPYMSSNEQFRGRRPLAWEGEPVVAWLLAPRWHAEVAGRDLGVPEDGVQRPYWGHAYDGTTAIRTSVERMAPYLPADVAGALRDASASGSSQGELPDPEWSAEVRLWISPAS